MSFKLEKEDLLDRGSFYWRGFKLRSEDDYIQIGYHDQSHWTIQLTELIGLKGDIKSIFNIELMNQNYRDSSLFSLVQYAVDNQIFDALCDYLLEKHPGRLANGFGRILAR